MPKRELPLIFAFFVLFAVLFAVLCITSCVSVSAEILEVCPNCGNYEYVKVKVTCDNAILSDGEGKIPLNAKNKILVAAKNATEFYRRFGFYPDIEAQKVDRRFALSNQGEEIFLLCNGTLEDTLAYGKSGSGLASFQDREVVYFRNNGSWDFRYVDWTDFEPIYDTVSGRIIVFPNELEIKAEKSLILVSYTLPEELNLRELAKKGVKIEIFLDSSPVGGIPLEEVEILKDLKAENVEVHFLDSNSYKNFHYKFAIVDGRKVIITTENWKTSNRGYMVELESEKIAKMLLDVINSDRKYTSPTSSHGKISDLKGFKKSGISGKEVEFEGEVEVFVLPDYNPIFGFISSSKEELLIEVPYMDLTWFGTDKLLDLIENACKNGSKVRILLDSKYSKERNEKLISFLNELARKKGYDLEAKLIALKGFESLHGKMIYSDGNCVITSANFNEYGFKLNREVGIIIKDKKACEFLRNQFYEDWKDRFEVLDFTEELTKDFPKDFTKDLTRIPSPFTCVAAILSLLTAFLIRNLRS